MAIVCNAKAVLGNCENLKPQKPVNLKLLCNIETIMYLMLTRLSQVHWRDYSVEESKSTFPFSFQEVINLHI